MINKIIREDKPEYILVAFDKGKTFRHEKYTEYKEKAYKAVTNCEILTPLFLQTFLIWRNLSHGFSLKKRIQNCHVR